MALAHSQIEAVRRRRNKGLCYADIKADLGYSLADIMAASNPPPDPTLRQLREEVARLRKKRPSDVSIEEWERRLAMNFGDVTRM